MSASSRSPLHPGTPRICYAGTYERFYPRNRLVIQAFRDTGARVEEAHAPVFERQRDKTRLAFSNLVKLSMSLALAYLRLVPEVGLRLLRCDTLAIGYIGQLDMLVLAPIAKMMHRPVIFNPLITLTDTVVEDRALVSPTGFLAKIVRAIDSLALRLANVILVDTDANREYLIETFGVRPEKVIVMPVGADPDLFFPACVRETKSESLDVLFYGKFIPLHGIQTIIQAARLVEDVDPTVRFELIGTGQQYQRACDLAEDYDLVNLIWLNWLAYASLGKRIRQADVVLGIFGEGAKAARVVPNKVHQALACGTAVITRESPAIEKLVEDQTQALLIPPADAPALANAILSLRDEGMRTKIAEAGHRAGTEHASPVVLQAIARTVLKQLELSE